MVRARLPEAAGVDLTPMIDLVFQLIIFFMVVMSVAVVYGVAVRFPSGDGRPADGPKQIQVYVQADLITSGHQVLRDGVVKVNGEEISLTHTVLGTERYWLRWDEEREAAFGEVERRMRRMAAHGYRTDVVAVGGDVKAYHGKIARILDRAKRVGIEGFALTSPLQ
jgi:biopolymer transport protein ExbD